MDGSEARMKVAEARALKQEIENEITQVESILRQAVAACNEFPGEGDTVIEAIEKVGQELDENWTKLIDGFKKIGPILDNIIDNLAKWAEQVVEKLTGMNKSN